ncbi:hypothetical protein DPX16_1838 [Anabarilius grahami]|uniref:Uncharacterized protein n=1 Tax=Anabarilius grahami TaxID=495550 RepID=A0A3N0Z936_ANAGA|nr:hypothetical protein DPX16_1838 [Anabarilius grahami]
MFPSFHRCNLCRTKLPHDSETSCRCSVKSLRSTAQFSFVSESIRMKTEGQCHLALNKMRASGICSRCRGSGEQGNEERVENGRQVERGSYHPRPHLNWFYLRNMLKETY